MSRAVKCKLWLCRRVWCGGKTLCLFSRELRCDSVVAGMCVVFILVMPWRVVAGSSGWGDFNVEPSPLSRRWLGRSGHLRGLCSRVMVGA